MHVYIAQEDCFSTNSKCTSLNDNDPFGDCWKNCKQSENTLYLNVVKCLEECGASENSKLITFGIVHLLIILYIFL